jgi:hypothetical protein
MTALFTNFWVLMLLAYLIGALVTWVVLKLALPDVGELEAATGRKSEGVL